ncbi:MAG: hypothetical protein ISEC1_P0488 [Thiomicrorhabdus sp.]|nr:MAG: hypothetical protein ISEC1_P0488 [Thiomicrorhabdus sp.]
MKKLLTATIIALSLSACSTYQPEIVQTGPDSYFILKQAEGFPGVDVLKGDVTKQASGYCKSINKKLHILSVHETRPPYSVGNRPRGEIKFKCL